MTDETRTDNTAADDAGAATGSSAKPGGVAIAPQRQKLLPGLMAIGLYMLVLALVSVMGVVSRQVQPAFLIFSALFIAAALGLMLMLRWAWALTLAAVTLLVGLFAWKFYQLHEFPFLAQGLMNMVFFLYLVRTEVRKRLR